MNLERPYGPRDETATLNGDRFFAGIDERRSPQQLEEGLGSYGQNLRFRRGRAESRKGVVLCPWMKGTGRTPWSEVYGGVVFSDPNQGGDWFVIAADGGVWKTRPNMVAQPVPLPSGVTLTAETFAKFVPNTDGGSGVLVLLRGPDADPLVCLDLDAGFTAIPGSSQAVTSLTSSSTTATGVAAGHGFSTSQTVTIAGATPDEYNGSYTITVVDSDSFTYTFAGVADAPATGTITARRTGFRDMPRSSFGLNHLNRLLLIEGKDIVAASDILAYNDFIAVQNEYRINPGNSQALVALTPMSNSTLLCFKSQSVLAVTGVANATDGSLTGIGPEPVSDSYGVAGPQAIVRKGANCYWLTNEPSITNLRLTELNETQDTDVRLSDPMIKTFGRINGRYLSAACLEVWDGKLYCALPLDDAGVRLTVALTVADKLFSLLPTVTPLRIPTGASYYFTPGNAAYVSYETSPGNFTALAVAGWFTPGADAIVYVLVLSGQPWTGSLSAMSPATCNAVAVYDFVTQQWCGVDEAADVFAIKAFLKTPYLGRQRLFWLGTDGTIRLYEEGFEDDVLAADGSFTTQPVATTFRSRGYQQVTGDRARANSAVARLATWHPSYTLATLTPGYNSNATELAAVTRSNTVYDLYDTPEWDASNANDDHEAPGRQDYSVALPDTGFNLGSGVNFDAHQISTDRLALSRTGDWQQIELTNTSGRLELLNLQLEQISADRAGGNNAL